MFYEIYCCNFIPHHGYLFWQIKFYSMEISANVQRSFPKDGILFNLCEEVLNKSFETSFIAEIIMYFPISIRGKWSQNPVSNADFLGRQVLISENVSNEEVLRKIGTSKLILKIRKWLMKFLGHIMRIDSLENMILTRHTDGKRHIRKH